MRAYYHDNAEGEGNGPHDSGEAVRLEDLAGLLVRTESFAVDADRGAALAARIAAEGEYAHLDEFEIGPDASEAELAGHLEMFFREHLHEDFEARLITHGLGYFDIRDRDDRWVRVAAGPGDFICLPAGIYHRFVSSTARELHAWRLFKDNHRWSAIYRPLGDAEPVRTAYLQQLAAVDARAGDAGVAEARPVEVEARPVEDASVCV